MIIQTYFQINIIIICIFIFDKLIFSTVLLVLDRLLLSILLDKLLLGIVLDKLLLGILLLGFLIKRIREVKGARLEIIKPLFKLFSKYFLITSSSLVVY